MILRTTSRTASWLACATVGAAMLPSCSRQPETTTASTPEGAPAQTKAATPGCDEGNGGLKLPAGFCASVFAENLGHARHLAVAPNGDVYVNTWSSKYGKFTNVPGGFIVALRDADRDGHAEVTERFGTTFQEGKPGGGSGIAFYKDALYVEVDNKIVRYPWTQGTLVPAGQPATVVMGLPMEGDHPMHTLAIAQDGTMFVNSGSTTNSCQQKNRTALSPGIKPCAKLATHAGIWRYSAAKTDQKFSPNERVATGARNTVGLAVGPDGALYAAIHGRDSLSEHWPKLYTEAQNNELPAEKFVRASQGNDFGWPYCYFDQAQDKYVLSPEYGGDGGKAIGDCASKTKPLVSFPAHWAPEAVAFYNGSAFPTTYQGGAFVSFHGSWNRKPAQAGFLVAFVPFNDGIPTGKYEEFATGFAGAQLPADPQQAAHRPMGLAVGPDGSLYVTDDKNGRIWKISVKK